MVEDLLSALEVSQLRTDKVVLVTSQKWLLVKGLLSA